MQLPVFRALNCVVGDVAVLVNNVLVLQVPRGFLQRVGDVLAGVLVAVIVGRIAGAGHGLADHAVEVVQRLLFLVRHVPGVVHRSLPAGRRVVCGGLVAGVSRLRLRVLGLCHLLCQHPVSHGKGGLGPFMRSHSMGLGNVGEALGDVLHLLAHLRLA